MRNGVLLGLGLGAGALLGSALQVEPAHACSCVVVEPWQFNVESVTGSAEDEDFWLKHPAVRASYAYELLEFEKGDESRCAVEVKE